MLQHAAFWHSGILSSFSCMAWSSMQTADDELLNVGQLCHLCPELSNLGELCLANGLHVQNSFRDPTLASPAFRRRSRSVVGT